MVPVWLYTERNSRERGYFEEDESLLARNIHINKTQHISTTVDDTNEEYSTENEDHHE